MTEETSESATTAVTMPPLEDAEPLEGAAAPDTGTYKPAGNKFTRSHSPKTKDDDSEVKPPPISLETTNSSQCQQEHQEQTVEDNLPTPDFCPGTPDVVMAQLDQEQHEKGEQPPQPEASSATNPAEVKADKAMVDPLQVLLASALTTLESTTVTEEEDLLLDVSNVTTTEVVARPPPEQAKDSSGGCKPDEKDNVQLTSADVGDNMGDI